VYNHGKDLIEKFGYDELFTDVPLSDPNKHINEHNAEVMKQCLKQAESDEIISMRMNNQEECVRRFSEKYPMVRGFDNIGRTIRN
jgi:hypothetical protein